jgi:glutamate dehydrogenase/leucine dehydrogenase
MSFCQAFMTELSRHIGANTDVPAGDIGVGGREIGFLFGQYKRIRNEFTGILTGKGLEYGGSLIRPEATGYGLVYFLREMLQDKGESLKGQRCIVSGSGNVAQYTVERLLGYGAIPLTVSDSAGYILCESGITTEFLKEIMAAKNDQRIRLSEMKLPAGAQYFPGSVWAKPPKATVALPSATQNEIDAAQAQLLVDGGVKAVAEGANMPSTPEAIACYLKNNVGYGPAKAANAGGVGVSAMEMSQNAMFLSWTREEVDAKLDAMMKNIFAMAKAEADHFKVSLADGANIAGARKLFSAMHAQGVL